MSKFFDLIAKCEENDELYDDPVFRPNDAGIRGDQETFLPDPLNNLFEWKRAKDCLENPLMFEGEIEPSDIKQGSVGDCWFLSAISALAEYPERIYRIFKNRHHTEWPLEEILEKSLKYGVYCVNMLDDGEMKEIIMDDYFVNSKQSKNLCFAKGVNDELWAMVLEKAMAAKYGSYAQIAAGQPSMALHDLTGAPGLYKSHASMDKDYMWDCIVRDLERKYVLVCTAKEGTVEDGIVADHAYSVLSAHSFERDGEQVRLLKIRNPWGYKEWQGAWSDDSEEWNTLAPEVKESVLQGHVSKNDGKFFMSYDDYLANYQGVFICQVVDDNKYSHISHEQDNKHGQMYSFTITKAGKYTLQVSQKDRRKLPKSTWSSFKYNIIQMVVGKKIAYGTDWSFVSQEQIYDYDREVWAEKKNVWTDKEDATGYFEEGDYQVWVKAQWRDDNTQTYVLSAYGPDKVDFSKIEADKTKFFVQVYTDLAKKKEPKSPFSGDTTYVYERSGGVLYLVFFSQYEDQSLLWTNKFDNTGEGFKVMKPHGNGRANMELPPKGTATCLVSYKGWDVDYDLSWDNFKFA